MSRSQQELRAAGAELDAENRHQTELARSVQVGATAPQFSEEQQRIKDAAKARGQG